MIVQPPADSSHMPRQMVSRVDGGGPTPPTPHDKAMCAKARGEALKKQREALGAPVVIKTGALQRDREKMS